MHSEGCFQPGITAGAVLEALSVLGFEAAGIAREAGLAHTDYRALHAELPLTAFVSLWRRAGSQRALRRRRPYSRVSRRRRAGDAYDQRGHGESGGDRGQPATEYGRDAVAMTDALTLPVVVGASLGGFAALLALADAEVEMNTAGLALVDVVPDPDPDRARRFLATLLVTSSRETGQLSWSASCAISWNRTRCAIAGLGASCPWLAVAPSCTLAVRWSSICTVRRMRSGPGARRLRWSMQRVCTQLTAAKGSGLRWPLSGGAGRSARW